MKYATHFTRLNGHLIFLLAFVLIASRANAQVYTQDFSFSGALTSNSWTAHSGGGTNPISTTTGLFYSGHSGSGVGNAVQIGNAGGEDDNQVFTSQTGTVYYSLLVNITDVATSKTGDYFFHVGSPGGAGWTAFSGRVFARIVSGNVNFGISNTGTATYGTTNFSRNTTYLVVVKHTLVAGTTTDPLSMWVVPSGMPASEVAAGAAEVTNTTTNGTDAIAAVGLRQGSSTTSPQVVVDAIRVGTTWASVVPSSGSAPSTQASGILFSSPTASTVHVAWTAGNGDGRIVKINTTNTFTDPTGGATYTANATYAGSGEQVVSAGTSLSATVSGLTAGQTYYFRAYEYSNTGMLYNTATATDNPANTTLSFPVPTLTSISPTNATAGASSFTLTVSGSDFYSSSVVNWNGSPRTTTYVNSTTLTAAITTTDIASAGTASVTVTNSTPGGGTSSSQTFSINASTSPLISVSSSFTPFSTVSGTPSASQSYTVAGTNLSGDITIIPPVEFELRTGTNAFSSTPITLTPAAGTVVTTTIDVRFNPSSSGFVTGSIDHTSPGATTEAVSVSGFSLESEPNTPSVISFGTISGNSMVVNTSGGSGTSRVIVIREAAAVTYTPTDGATVSGVNASVTAALDQGSGNKIVYDGTGTTVTVTGLSPTTTYYFAVYEYNGTGATSNYQTTGFGTANATTIAAEPTTNSTLTLTRIKSDTAYAGLSGGNGTNRLIVISTSAVTFVPSDGSTYSGASAALSTATDLGGGNYLLYNGATISSLTVTGLSTGTTYYLRAYDYNGSGASTNYRTSSFGSTTFTMPSNIPYTTPGATYIQDFNGLPSTGTFGMTGFGPGPYYLSTPSVNATGLTGWQHMLVPGGSGADLAFAVDNGASSTGGVKSYGATGSANRALGSLATGTSVPAFGAVFVNNTGVPLTTLNITYTGQQWRLGGNGTPNQLAFSFALNGSSITSGTFVSAAALNFNNPVSTGIAGALDGTLAGNRQPVSGTIALPTNWMPGQTLAIRWLDNNDAGSDEGMAIDDFTFTALGPQVPTQQDSLLSFTNVLTTSMDVNWQNGNGTSRIVVMNTSNNFTSPVDGTTYTANATYGGTGEQVVYNGTGSVVHVDGLSAGTMYHFRVFAYNGSGASAVYSTVASQSNPASQTTAAASAATKLVITSVNGGNDPVNGTPFSVVVQAQDNVGNPQSVNLSTTVSLSINTGFGTLGGTLSGVIPSGSSSVTISGVTYSPEEFGVQLDATATSGMALTTGTSNAFNVLGLATQLFFTVTPTSGIFNTPVTAIEVQAYRNDFSLDPNYTGAVTLSVSSGPGSISGTTTVNCVAGVATFTGISFSLPGTYELTATATGLISGVSSTITITLNPVFTELVVPKYIAAKTAPGAHNARAPFAVCLKIDNLVPNTAYDVKAGVGTDTTVSSTYGSGNTWLGTIWGVGTISSAFTTDATGSSGPFWVFIQPTASSTNSRFAAGFNHNLRIGFVASGGLMPTAPNFVGTKQMTALDVGTTAQTPATTDDGAFLKGSSVNCVGGKYVLVYDNVAGTGDPLSVYQARMMVAPNTVSQTELPALINDVFLQTSTNPVGDYAAVVPIGANNANGVRRIEVRNADNTLLNAVTDTDGNWGTGGNTTTLLRRDVAVLSSSMANLNTVTVSASSTGESCTGTLDGTATATATSVYTPLNYSWNTTPAQITSMATGLAAGNYTVTVTDAVGCSATAATTVSAPPGATVTASGPTTFCNGGSVTLTAGSASAYSWSNGETTSSITVTTSGTYTVSVTFGSCIATSLPTTVAVNNYEFTGTLYAESMGTVSGTTTLSTYTGWQNYPAVTYTSTSATPVDVRATTTSSGYTGASGVANVYFGASASAPARNFIVSGINTAGYTSLTMTFGLKRDAASADLMSLEYSTDGTNWSPMTITNPTGTTWTLVTVSSTVPATGNLRLRFSKNSTTATFRLDDLKITGTTSTPSVTALGATAVCGTGSLTLQANVPSGIVWSYNGSTARTLTATATGSYGYTATGTNGCTATAAPVTFTIHPEPNASISSGTISCNGGTTTVSVTATDGTAPYSNTGSFTVSAGTPSYIVTDANGCDDTVSVSITQPAAITGSGSVSACDSYTWSANGITYTASGSYTAVLLADNGCDSTATLNLTITQSSQSTQNVSSCDSYTWSANGQTYTQSGIYSMVSGCHTDFLNLTITQSSQSSQNASSCDSYTWAIDGQTYTQSGIYSAVSGCHTDLLNLTINASSTNTTTVSNCNSYTWSVNGQTYTQSGTYSSVSGCHTEILALTITSCGGGVTLDLTAYLEGYYAGTGTMQSVLANQGVAGAVGTETDTILVELHDSLDPIIIVDQAQMLLMADGSALGTFTSATAGTSYWIVIKHRMSIQTWSASPVLFSSATSYDFSTSDSQTFGSNIKQVETGVWAIYSADLNQDEFVDPFDYGMYEYDALSFASGYFPTDMNGDGFVDPFDYGVYETNSLNFTMSAHP